MSLRGDLQINLATLIGSCAIKALPKNLTFFTPIRKAVIVAGLDMDYEGNPFGPMPNLMACADDVKKVHAICVETGNPAGYSFRKEKNKDLVLIGEKKEYEPLSREIFIKKMSKRKL